MSYQLIRANALSLPLADESVDLIVTSPPSDADSVEFLCSQVERFHFVGQCGVTPRTRAAFRPYGQERLGDEHPSGPGPDVRHGPVSDGLDHGPVGLPQQSGRFGHRHHRLARHHFRHREPLAPGAPVHIAQRQGVLRSVALDPQVRQQRLEHGPARSGVDLPAPQRPATFGARFVAVQVPAERLTEQTGTTPAVAHILGRHGIGIDLSADYLRLAEWRCNDPGLRAKVLRVDKPKAVPDGQLDIFGEVA